MTSLSRRGLLALLAAPFAGIGSTAVANAAAAPTHATKPAAGHAKISPITSLAPPPRLLKSNPVNTSGTVQAQIAALQSQINALQSNENGFATFCANTFAFANTVRIFATSTSDSLNAHYHYSEIQGGAWILTSGPQW